VNATKTDTPYGVCATLRAASGGDGFRTAPLVADRIAEAVVGEAA